MRRPQSLPNANQKGLHKRVAPLSFSERKRQMKFVIAYINSQNNEILFQAIQYWMPRIGEKLSINDYNFIVTDITYHLSKGESASVSVTIKLEIIF